MIPLIVIRPQPGADATVRAARELGLDARAFPLFAIKSVAWNAPDPDEVDGLLIGSANAVRCAGHGLPRFFGKPAYVVGQVTAEACRYSGLTVAAIGVGGLQAVLDGIAPARLLRLCGRERVPLQAPAGVTLVERIVYASNPLPFAAQLVALLGIPCAVALHSAEAARHFAAECDLHSVDRSHITLIAIGPRVGGAAGIGWAHVAIAASPDDAALLAQAVRLCQNPAETRADEGGECRTRS